MRRTEAEPSTWRQGAGSGSREIGVFPADLFDHELRPLLATCIKPGSRTVLSGCRSTGGIFGQALGRVLRRKIEDQAIAGPSDTATPIFWGDPAMRPARTERSELDGWFSIEGDRVVMGDCSLKGGWNPR